MKYMFYSLVLVFGLTGVLNAQQVIDTIEVSIGWNMIGALESGRINFPASGITLDLILTNPPGIISSPFWGFTPGGGYYQADSLKRGTGYWIKVNQDGKLMYMSFTDCGTVDYAGRIYNTVLIGDQCWLKENLDVGTRIDGIQNQSDNGVIEKYCYNDSVIYCYTNGALYQWYEMMQYSTTPGVQGICPPGWHIPTLAEFQTLSTVVGGDGNALKAIGQGIGIGVGTNESGFSALMAGNRDFSPPGAFLHLGRVAYIWSSTQYDANNSNLLYLGYSENIIFLHNMNRADGFSVRCVKD